MLGKGKPPTVPSDAQAQEKLALYVYEYLKHMGANKTAQTFLSETRWDKNITVGDAPGFLCSWWCVFWDLYCAAPERRDSCDHTSEAKAFHDYGFVGGHPGGGMMGPGGMPPGAVAGGAAGGGGPSPMPPSEFFPGGPGPQGPGPMPVDIRGPMPMDMRGPNPGMMQRGGPGVMAPRMAPGGPMGYRPRPGGWPVGPMGPMPPGPGPHQGPMPHGAPPGPVGPAGPGPGPGPPSSGPYSAPSPYSAGTPVAGPGTPGAGIMPSPQDPNANCESMYGPPRPMSSMSSGGGHPQFLPDSDLGVGGPQQQQQQQPGMNGVGSSPHPNIPAVSDYLHFSESHMHMQPGPPLQSHQQAILQQQQQQQQPPDQNDSAKILKIKESMKEESERLYKKEGHPMDTDFFSSQ